MKPRRPLLLAASCLTLLNLPVLAGDISWIWSAKKAADNEVRFFRKEVTLEAAPKNATLKASGDNQAIVYVNGEKVGESTDWKRPIVVSIEKQLKQGANVIAVRAKNEDGGAALVVDLQVEGADGKKIEIGTDETWLWAEKETPNWNKAKADLPGWAKPVTINKLGAQPWGNVFSDEMVAAKPTGATPAETLATLPGFQVELLMSADKEKHGSWVSLATDPQGRLLLGSQTGNKITRLTVKDGKVVNDEDLKLPITDAMGLLYAFDSLYINGAGAEGRGIYRFRDAQKNGTFEKGEKILSWGGTTGGGEHGAHGIVPGPDGKLYVVNGNFTDAPVALAPNSPHRNFADDLVLGRAEDGNGFGANRKPPGGFVLRMDPDGKNAQMFAAGERNTYDIAFNPDGELLAFDSDMEWDWGMPWYRPTRVYHIMSGADHGFREGTGKWPTYYADSVPEVVNIGAGSPTGVVFGTGAKFPAKYQKAFYALDWTYGRLVATHLQPQGASYTATWENLVAPKALASDGPKLPLNLTDAVVGADGALYFTTGGRGTQAGLYRVTYTGKESTAPVDGHDTAGKAERALRHQLEAFHGKADPKAVATAWPVLGNADRALRYTARIAIESQPLAEWKEKALQETNPVAAMPALLALARLGGAESQPALLTALAKFPLSKMTEEQQLAKIRVLEVTLSRDGVPAQKEALTKELDALFPASSSFALNRELSQILIALDAPTAVAKTVKLLQDAKTQEEQISYVFALRKAKTGWTMDLRKAFLGWWLQQPKGEHLPGVVKWFEDAGRPYANGSSFANFLGNFHRDSVQTLTSQEIDQLQSVLAAYVPPAAKKQRQSTKPRQFVKLWTLADLEPSLPQLTKGRDFNNGRDAFAAAQCLLCHRFGDEGGAVGPDLTSISARFSPRDILESIIDPSKVISEQYANEQFTLKDGGFAMGRLVGETDTTVSVRPSLLAPDVQQVKKADITAQTHSPISPMPPGLISNLTEKDVLDLLAYMASQGKADAPAFQK